MDEGRQVLGSPGKGYMGGSARYRPSQEGTSGGVIILKEVWSSDSSKKKEVSRRGEVKTRGFSRGALFE